MLTCYFGNVILSNNEAVTLVVGDCYHAALASPSKTDTATKTESADKSDLADEEDQRLAARGILPD
jgi:hypothetical protein